MKMRTQTSRKIKQQLLEEGRDQVDFLKLLYCTWRGAIPASFNRVGHLYWRVLLLADSVDWGIL